jgi:hypothetical protein
MRVRYAAGEIVDVDSGVFTASPIRGEGWVRCEVVCDTDNVDQTYISPLPPHLGSPLYVRPRDIRGPSLLTNKENANAAD